MESLPGLSGCLHHRGEANDVRTQIKDNNNFLKSSVYLRSYSSSKQENHMKIYSVSPRI